LINGFAAQWIDAAGVLAVRPNAPAASLRPGNLAIDLPERQKPRIGPGRSPLAATQHRNAFGDHKLHNLRNTFQDSSGLDHQIFRRKCLIPEILRKPNGYGARLAEDFSMPGVCGT